MGVRSCLAVTAVTVQTHGSVTDIPSSATRSGGRSDACSDLAGVTA
ncbi:hypothetical protein [Mesorhizobium sp. M1399]